MAIDDERDHCAQIQTGQEVLLLAQTDRQYGDLLKATWRLGDTLVLDLGRIMALNHPDVRVVAE